MYQYSLKIYKKNYLNQLPLNFQLFKMLLNSLKSILRSKNIRSKVYYLI